jgi:hypothetical protein
VEGAQDSAEEAWHARDALPDHAMATAALVREPDILVLEAFWVVGEVEPEGWPAGQGGVEEVHREVRRDATVGEPVRHGSPPGRELAVFAVDFEDVTVTVSDSRLTLDRVQPNRADKTGEGQA